MSTTKGALNTPSISAANKVAGSSHGGIKRKQGKQQHGATASGTSAASSSQPPTLSLKIVRSMRHFHASTLLRIQWVRVNPIKTWGYFVVLPVWGYLNWYQNERMSRFYADYDQVKNETGGMYASTKVQELADVRGYNSEVERMRAELKERNKKKVQGT